MTLRVDSSTALAGPPLHPELPTARREVVAGARAMAADKLVVGRVGNLSRRVGDRVLVTPTRVPYEEIGPVDLVCVGLEGDAGQSRAAASRELPLHLAVYRRRPDLSALVHTHSPHATAWSFLGEPLLPITEDNLYYGIGPVLTNPPAASGSTALAESAAATLADSAAVLLGRHGVLAGGASVGEALEIAKAVEHQAQVAWLLRAEEKFDQIANRIPETGRRRDSEP